MRLIAAVLLLVLLLAGWMEDFHFCFRYSVQVEQFYQMNATEQALKDNLAIELSRSNGVRIVEESFYGRRGLSYPGDFVYSAEMEGDTVYFILQEVFLAAEEFRIEYFPESNRELPPRISLQDFFQLYIPEHSAALLASDDLNALSGNWPPYIFYHSPAIGDCISPPPELRQSRFIAV